MGGRVLIKIDPEGNHMSENLESPNPDDKGTLRLERRWKRREAVRNSLNCVASATRKTAKICGNKAVVVKDENDHIIDDDRNVINLDEEVGVGPVKGSILPTYNLDSETDTASYHRSSSNINANFGNNNDSDAVDEDYASFLHTYNPDIEIDYASDHIDGSNIDVDFGINNDGEEVNADYASFLATYHPTIETDRASNHWGGGSNNEVHFSNNNDDDEVDTNYKSFLATYHPDIETDCDSNHRGGSNIDINFGNNNGEDEGQGVETDCASNRIVGSNSGVNFGNNNDDDEVDADYGSFFPTNVERNSLLSDQEFHTPELQGDVDEDYALFLKSGCTNDGDFVHTCDKNTTNTPNVEDETNSSDSDLMVLESYQICDDTPFVPSKTYDPSCFVEEVNPSNNKKVVSYGQSQYRKRLFEQLDRPYDQEEYKSLLSRAYKVKQKERHFETRRRVIENYSSKDVTESYLETYPDLGKAIAKEAQKKPRILFLLRGFFFWIENCCHMGSFQPWQDKSCLEMMQKM